MRFWHQLLELLCFRDRQNWRSECMAASMPHFWPKNSCIFPPRDVRSCLMQSTIMRPVIRRITSPIPIGLTPGYLSRATSRQPLYEIKSSGGIMDVARFARKQKVVYASHRHRDLKARQCHESSLHAFGQAWH